MGRIVTRRYLLWLVGPGAALLSGCATVGDPHQADIFSYSPKKTQESFLSG